MLTQMLLSLKNECRMFVSLSVACETYSLYAMKLVSVISTMMLARAKMVLHNMPSVNIAYTANKSAELSVIY